MSKSAEFSLEWYCYPEDKYTWPVDSIAELYAAAAQGNEVLADEPGGLERFHASYENGSVILLLVRDTLTNKHIAGLLIEQGDVHLRSCLSVGAAMVLPEYRHRAVSSMLHRAYLRLAKAAGLRWLCTTEYTGRGTYTTRYRRLHYG